ncbi:hypothetical protein GMDG_04883 [Pseudogymnoascus destructans 20631-21]|uniref:CCHC-type domain-containing protein n=1 Tax=Pseudogymnoascus destructans (strain ATCC MYA-4855 / 20631-21) TaxID=658429 RepID=L8GCS8_PSED2|nr:hypothetical protein GMDG_04883 [Pseudogymnoascus destructans 20631-21]
MNDEMQSGHSRLSSREGQQLHTPLSFNSMQHSPTGETRLSVTNSTQDHVKDEISRSDKPDDLREMIELAQKIDNRHYERQLEKKGGPPSQHWTQRRKQTKSHWPQPMELDATFKPNGKPHNPNKERQFQERLCFNYNKPGHIARNCRQSKKGNGGRKYGKQLNATWQGQGGCKAPRGQLCATLKGKENWSITTQDLEEFHLSNREDKNDDKELTSSQKHQLQAFEKTASKTLFKEQLPGAVRTFKEAMLQEMVDQRIPVPKPPMSWQDTTQYWEIAVRTVRCRPEYPHQQESIPREERGTRVLRSNRQFYDKESSRHTRFQDATEDRSIPIMVVDGEPISTNNGMKEKTSKDRKELCATTESDDLAQASSLKQIPVEYKEYKQLFWEGPNEEALPKHQPWDHEIPIMEGKSPPFGPIYQMSAAELDVLKEYIDENLAKRFIRPSTSPAGSPILFVPKQGQEAKTLRGLSRNE